MSRQLFDTVRNNMRREEAIPERPPATAVSRSAPDVNRTTSRARNPGRRRDDWSAAALKSGRWIGRRLSVARYMKLPDDGNRYELIHGELVMSPSASYAHGEVLLYVGAKLGAFVRKRGLGRVGIETDVILADGLVLRPDINFVAKRRNSIIREHVHGAPDLVIEITSPGNWQNDLHFKRREYERFGVREYWLLDVADGRNRAFFWKRSRGRFVGGLSDTTTLRSHVLKGFNLDLALVWKVASEGGP